MANPEQDGKKLEDVFFGTDFPNAEQMLEAMRVYEADHQKEGKNSQQKDFVPTVTNYDNW